jgi:hypothetical protein
MCDGFLHKKKSVGCRDHPDRKRPNVCEFTRKKWQISDAFLVGPTLDAPGSSLSAGVFFLLLKERKRSTVTFFMIFFIFNFVNETRWMDPGFALVLKSSFHSFNCSYLFCLKEVSNRGSYFSAQIRLDM